MNDLTTQQPAGMPAPDVFECRFDSTCLWTPMAEPRALAMHAQGSAMRKLYNEFTVAKLVGRIAELEAAVRGVDTRPPIGEHNLNRADGGRAYVSEFFSKRMRRHDFRQYIAERLAVDFACALAEYLHAHDFPAAVADGAFRQRVERLLIDLHASDALSEGQCAKVLDIDRISWREIADKAAISDAPAVDAGAIPAAVIAWRNAYQTFIDTTARYNDRVKEARSFGLGSISVDAEYQAMNEAQRAAMSLLKPMHAALSASTEAAAGEPIHPAERVGHSSHECDDCKWAQRQGESRCEGCVEEAERATAQQPDKGTAFTAYVIDTYGIVQDDDPAFERIKQIWTAGWDARTAPPAASGQKLTDEQIADIAKRVTAEMHAEAPGFRVITHDEFNLRFARAILHDGTESAFTQLVAEHAELLEANAYCYFELAYTRRTGWMAWITDRPAQGEPGTAEYAKSRNVIARGSGDTAEAACADALSLLRAARAKDTQ